MKRAAKGFVILLVALVAVVFVVGLGDRDEAATTKARPVGVTKARARAETASRLAPARSAARKKTASPAVSAATQETDDPLSVYLADAMYPPTSRPLRAEQEDLIHPDRRHDSRRLATSDPSVTFLLTADRLFVTGDDEVTLTLEVWRGAAPLAVRVTRAEAFAEGALGEPSAPPAAVTFVSEGLSYAARVFPGRLVSAEKAVFFSVKVTFDDGGSLSETARLRLQLTPSNAIPARFSGVFEDEVKDGSLVIQVGIDVLKEGRYAVDANLWDAGGKPVAWARFKGALRVGDTSLPLRFFGKVILDAEPSLPLRLGELRGVRLAEGEDPDLEAIPRLSVAYEAGMPSLAGLSPDVWDSPKKRAMIRMLSAAEADPAAPRLSAVSLR